VNKDAKGTPPRSANSSMGVGLLLGAALGAGVALLLAPRSGKETRRRLADTGGRWNNAARSKVAQARNIANDLKRDAASALEAGREAFEHSQKASEPRASSRPS
jgi:gas vesicle protein